MNVGDKVRLTRRESVEHFREAGMPTVGIIAEIDADHMEGRSHRPVKVKFTDGRESWYGSWEIRKIK